MRNDETKIMGLFLIHWLGYLQSKKNHLSNQNKTTHVKKVECKKKLPRQKLIVKSSESRLSNEAIKRQAESMRNLDDYATNTMKLNVLPAESIQRLKDKTELTKRRRRKIKDKLLIINVTEELEVPSKIVEVIKELGLE